MSSDQLPEAAVEPIVVDRDESLVARSDDARSKRRMSALALFVVLAAAASGAYLWWQQQATPAPAPVAAEPVAMAQGPIAPPADAEPAIEHPMEAAPAEPLPPVDDSDALLAEAIGRIVGEKQWSALFIPESVVRHLVTTVDNLPRHEAPVRMWPVHPTGAWLETVGGGDAMSIGPKNAARYARYVKLVKGLDAEATVAVYRRFYPLFQSAYRDLGFPKGYFNDRLIVAIDDLLATPDVTRPLQLTQDKVLYQFADPALERRSAGQKIMLRIGPENSRVVKAKLREIRQALLK
jgi:hypothetical protein